MLTAKRNGENPVFFTHRVLTDRVAHRARDQMSDEEACDAFDEMRRDLEEHRTGGLDR